MLELHRLRCPNFGEPRLQLSLDGVHESRSTSVSLDVYSIKIENCRQIYPIKIIRPLNKFNVEHQPQLKSILDSMRECNCVLTDVIADNLKRAILRGALNHASNYACEYCVAKAVQCLDDSIKSKEEKKKNDLKIKKYEKDIEELKKKPSSSSSSSHNSRQILLLTDRIEELKKTNSEMSKKKSHPVWPESTRTGEPRTTDSVRAIVESLEEDRASGGRSQLKADDVKGIVSRSLLLDYENFDFVSGITVEYMHCGCLGVVKRFI